MAAMYFMLKMGQSVDYIPNFGPLDGKIKALAAAIIIAEGSPPSWNNPGDLTRSFGFSNSGPQNSAGVLKFDTYHDGLMALYNQISMILNNTSSVYSTNTTFASLAQSYTGGDNADGWLNTVLDKLGNAAPDMTLGDWVQV